MRITVFLLFIAFVKLNGQSVIASLKYTDRSSFLESNHIVNTYERAYNNDITKTIDLNEKKIGFVLATSDTITWTGNKRTSKFDHLNMMMMET